MLAKSQSDLKKILIIRNDKLGDFMLTYPSFALLKRNLPDAALFAFVPSYTREMAAACPWVDQVLVDPEPKGKWRSAFLLSKMIKKEQFDAVITLFSTTRVGLAVTLAKIPYRLAPATKLAQIFYNYRLVQRRSRSEKPEYQYNQDLVRYFLKSKKIPLRHNPAPPFLHFDDSRIANMRSNFCGRYGIDNKHDLVFIHIGSGGSANTLSIQQYAGLAHALKSQNGHTIVITAGPGEIDNAKTFSKQLSDIPYVLYHSTQGLRCFSEKIQFADLFISGSTGPLHIAGALDIPTAGFYTRRRSATALRWQTLNSPSRRLSFSPEDIGNTENMQSIDLDQAARLISERFLIRGDS